MKNKNILPYLFLIVGLLFSFSKVDDYGTTKFGGNIQILDGPVSTTNNTTTAKVIIDKNTNPLDTGLYEIDINFAWNYSNTTSDIIMEMYIDKVKPYTQAHLFRAEPKDPNSNQYYNFSKKLYFKVGQPGPKNIRLDVKAQVAGRVARVYEPSVKIMRIK